MHSLVQLLVMLEKQSHGFGRPVVHIALRTLVVKLVGYHPPDLDKNRAPCHLFHKTKPTCLPHTVATTQEPLSHLVSERSLLPISICPPSLKPSNSSKSSCTLNKSADTDRELATACKHNRNCLPPSGTSLQQPAANSWLVEKKRCTLDSEPPSEADHEKRPRLGTPWF